jgi:hypothetical protein
MATVAVHTTMVLYMAGGGGKEERFYFVIIFEVKSILSTLQLIVRLPFFL